MQQIDSIISLSATYYTPVTEIEQDKVAALAASITANGWVGAPVIVDGDTAITGSHRLVAREVAEMEVIPVVEVSDLCTAYGIDWLEVLEVNGYDLRAAAREVGFGLPIEVVDYLGYDVE